jgi:hypothetical protein
MGRASSSPAMTATRVRSGRCSRTIVFARLCNSTRSIPSRARPRKTRTRDAQHCGEQEGLTLGPDANPRNPVAPTQGWSSIAKCRGGEVPPRHFAFLECRLRGRYRLSKNRECRLRRPYPAWRKAKSGLTSNARASRKPATPVCAASTPISGFFGVLPKPAMPDFVHMDQSRHVWCAMLFSAELSLEDP